MSCFLLAVPTFTTPTVVLCTVVIRAVTVVKGS